LSFADQVAVMRGGLLVQAGRPLDLYLRPRDAAVAGFLGDSIVLPAQLAGGWADCALGRIAVNDSARQGAAQIMLRPEQLQVAEVPAGNGSAGTRRQMPAMARSPTPTLAVRSACCRCAWCAVRGKRLQPNR
jgi:iron(III) transport system ATP-binding protein